jgi:hypothetical protein
MHRLLLATLLGTASVAAASVGTNPAVVEPPVLVEGTSNGKADAALTHDMQAQESIDEATAAALIGALKSRFEHADFELRLGDARSERVSLRDIALQGEAKIRFSDASSWLPVRYEALYDTSEQVVESPHITLGAEFAMPGPDATRLPLPRLAKAVDATLDADYQSNTVDVALRQARIVDDDGTRYVVQATGSAVFDGSDEVGMTVRALYDRKSGRWLDPQYDFDEAGYALAAR